MSVLDIVIHRVHEESGKSMSHHFQTGVQNEYWDNIMYPVGEMESLLFAAIRSAESDLGFNKKAEVARKKITRARELLLEAFNLLENVGDEEE